MALVLALILAGVVGYRVMDQRRQAQVQTVGGVSLLTDQGSLPWENTSSAGVGLGGKLGLIGGSCVGLAGQPGVVLAFPPGTQLESASGDTFELRLAGTTYRQGSQISGGGSGRPGLASLLPSQCAGHDVFSFDAER